MKKTIMLMSVAMLLSGVLAVNVQAALMFDSSLNDGDPNNQNFTTIRADEEPHPIGFGPDGVGVQFTGLGDDGRNYLVTQDNDYATTDFFMTVVADNLGRDEAGGANITFIGLGSGTIGDYGQPLGGNHVVARNWQTGAFGGAQGFDILNSGGDGAGGHADGAGMSEQIVRLGLQWTAATSTAVFRMDYLNNGTWDVERTVVNTDLVDGNSKLFFGGSNDVIFTDFSVIPEPSSALLLGIAGLAIGIVRRRRHG